MNRRQISRREFVYLSVGGGLLVAGYPLSRAFSQPDGKTERKLFSPTPSNTLGPYYKKGAPRREKLAGANASGKPLLVSGKVINTDGKILADATIEVFHSDAHGDYDMSGFNCRGEIPVRPSGEYSYETVVPGQYGGRAQHVHYVINAPGHRQLITQLYFRKRSKVRGQSGSQLHERRTGRTSRAYPAGQDGRTERHQLFIGGI